MREDCLEVDELLRPLADYKNDTTGMAAKNFYGSAQPVGPLTATRKTVLTTPSCPIVPAAGQADHQKDTGAGAPSARVRLGV